MLFKTPKNDVCYCKWHYFLCISAQPLLGDLLNPKATLFFLALFTQFIHPETPLVAQAAYGATIVGIAFVWYPLLAIAISQRLVRNTFQSVSYWVERITGAVLIALGLRLAITKAHD